MAITGKYRGKDATELSALRTQYETTRTACLTGGQSYSRPGMSFTRAGLSEINAELAEIEYAQRVAGGTLVTKQVADLSA